jgi:hypothetical protein
MVRRMENRDARGRAPSAADRAQAAQYLDVLVAVRRSACAELETRRAALEHVCEDQVVGIRRLARLRAEVREAERELDELDRVAARLIERFGNGRRAEGAQREG